MSQKPKGIAARAGRWSAQHRKTAIFGWLAFVIVAFVIGGATGTKKVEQTLPGESGRAQTIQEDNFQQANKKAAEETVLIQSKTLKANDPEYRAVVRDVEKQIGAEAHVRKVESPYAADRDAAISPDRHSVQVSFQIAGEVVDTKERVKPVLAATKSLQKAHPEFSISQFGDASIESELGGVFEKDMQKAETMSLPITLIILLLAFGALVAAGLPLLLGLTAVAGAMGVVAIVSQLVPVSDSTANVVLLVGLAVGVDYSLFYIRREREERKAGRSKEAALNAAAATSGRTVLISGLTVMVAMAGLYFAGDPTFAGLATGSIIVVAIAMLGSLTVLPAMLSKVGDGVDRGRIPFLGKRMQRRTHSRVWSAILRPVMRRPLVATVLSAAVLVGLSIPALGMHTATSGIEQLPQTPIMKTVSKMQKAFPGGEAPEQVVIAAKDVTTPEVKGAIADLKDRAAKTDGINDGVSVDYSDNHRVAVINLPIEGEGNDAKSYAALENIREDLVPATVGKLKGAEVVVGGNAAQSKDYNDLVKSAAPIVFAFVLTLAFLLLLVTFRSVVVPVKAIVLNLLSVGASYGVLTLVFQHGWLHEELGFETPGFVVAWLPLFLFVILFGLSMDYHVYILSRVREAYDKGMATEDAVEHGIKKTAGVVTSAAFVMVGVFGIFGTLSIVDFKMLGIGLAVAIFIDATIVRAVLLPATMKLLGDRNWYLPSWLQWLPRLDHEGSVEQPRGERESGIGPVPAPSPA